MVDEIDKPVKVLLWGCKIHYSRCIDRLRSLEADGIISIIGITGNEIPPWSKQDGYPVMEIESAMIEEYDLIILFMAYKNEREVIQFCFSSYGITRDRIIAGRLLEMPGFDFVRYLRLRREGLSIFSNGCWSGFLCHTLNIEHRSPTKNLYFTDPDYIQFLTNFTYYLKDCDPVFDKWKEGGYEGQQFFPVLTLGNIRLYCNHSDNAETEIAKWIRRRTQVNYGNMLFEFASEIPEYVYKFLELQLPGRKLCLTSIDTGHPDAVLIRALPGLSWLDVVNRSVDVYNSYLQFSLLDLALGDRPFVRFRL